jgi:hypothetical protein
LTSHKIPNFICQTIRIKFVWNLNSLVCFIEICLFSNDRLIKLSSVNCGSRLPKIRNTVECFQAVPLKSIPTFSKRPSDVNSNGLVRVLKIVARWKRSMKIQPGHQPWFFFYYFKLPSPISANTFPFHQITFGIVCRERSKTIKRQMFHQSTGVHLSIRNDKTIPVSDEICLWWKMIIVFIFRRIWIRQRQMA